MTAVTTRRRRLLGGGRFGLFSEMLATGLVVGLLALPGATAPAALAAGIRHLRRHIEGEPDTTASLLRDALSALRGSWLWGVAAAVVVALATINAVALDDTLPGAAVVRAVSIGAAVAIALVVLRAAASWRPGDRWGPLLRSSADRTMTDARGSAILLLALGLCALVVWMFAPLIVLVPGMLALAGLAVDRRAA